MYRIFPLHKTLQVIRRILYLARHFCGFRSRLNESFLFGMETQGDIGGLFREILRHVKSETAFYVKQNGGCSEMCIFAFLAMSNGQCELRI